MTICSPTVSASGATVGSAGLATVDSIPAMPRSVLTGAVAGHVSAADQLSTLFRISGWAKITDVVDEFTSRFTAIDKATWGQFPKDDVEISLDKAVTDAPAQFWTALQEGGERHDSSRLLIARIRNWMAQLARLKLKDRALPGLLALEKLHVTPVQAQATKLLPCLRSISQQEGLTGNTAKSLLDSLSSSEGSSTSPESSEPASGTISTISATNKPTKIRSVGSKSTTSFQANMNPDSTITASHRKVGNKEPVKRTKPQAQALPKLFSDMGAFSLGSHKRARVDTPEPELEPEPEPESQRARSIVTDQLAHGDKATEEPAPKKAKKKSVRWRDDSDLVAVRYFETDADSSHLRKTSSAREQDHAEASATILHIPARAWTTPQPLPLDMLSDCVGKLKNCMGIKRGGLLQPPSVEAKNNTEVVGNSTETPTEPPTDQQQPDATAAPRTGRAFIGEPPKVAAPTYQVPMVPMMPMMPYFGYLPPQTR